MSNILYIGPYREFSGMGNAARMYITALHRAGHHVSIRPIYNMFKTYPESEIPKEILDLENNSSTKYHVCIQHCYPHQLNYSTKVSKTIGIVHLESNGYGRDMRQYLNLADELIVGSRSCRNSITSCGCDKPIHIIPEPIDLDSFGSYRQLNPKKKNGFTFYALADFCLRKNLLDIILAYSVISSRYDYANLIIKTKQKNTAELSISNNYIKENIDVLTTVFNTSREAKRQPRIIVGDTSYKNILNLHNSGDCYIDVSSGESFGYATLEAIAFDNNIIVNEGTGSDDLLEEFGMSVSSQPTGCTDNHKPYFMYNSIFQSWQKPDINSLIEKMETAILETDNEKISRIEKQREKLKRCSVDSVSEMLRKI